MASLPPAALPDGVCLRVTGLSKQYGGLRALDRVTFEVRRGQVLGLIGPNGSGKTTLFECIGGVLPLDAGLVEQSEPHFYLPDGITPWPEQRVEWVLAYVAGFFGARDGMTTRVIETFALEPLLSKKVGQLSKGQLKRTLLAIGLLTPRPIVFADEPFDGLDLRQTRDVGGVLRDITHEGRTLVLSIHQISDAARVCDRFVLLSHGTVRGQGTLADIMTMAGERNDAGGLEEAFLALT